MSNEYKEPWKVSTASHTPDEGVIYVDDNVLSYPDADAVTNSLPHKTQKEVVERIAACVNACAGIPTKELNNPHKKLRLGSSLPVEDEEDISLEQIQEAHKKLAKPNNPQGFYNHLQYNIKLGDLFAMSAMQGLIVIYDGNISPDRLAGKAYEISQAMLREAERVNGRN